MKFKILLLAVIILLSLGTASADKWLSNSSIKLGLSDVGMFSSPTIYNDSGTWKLISGEEWGTFVGYQWNTSTSQWDSNSSLVAGLPDVGNRPKPEVFYHNSIWKLIIGKQGGTFLGYQWNTSTSQWDSNSSIVTGLGDIGGSSAPSIFNDSGTWKLITGNNLGTFLGFQWNISTSQWDSNSSIVTGLGDVGTSSSTPEVFYHNSFWKLITGPGYEQPGLNDFFGFQWNISTSQWNSNSSVVAGLGDIGTNPTANVFYHNSIWKMISGGASGNFYGYQWNNMSVTDNLMTEHVTNNPNVYTNTSAPYFNWTYSDTESDTQYSWEIQVGTVSGLSDMWASGQLLGTDLNDIYAGSVLARNTTYYVQVRTNDGHENGSWDKGTFKINTLPVVNNITITPGAPLDTDDLVVGNDTATDGDGDPTSVFYRWYKDDVHQPTLDDIITVNASNTTDDEVWKVGVIPNDTYENGTEVFSATVTIGSGNYAPTLTAITTNVSTKKYGYDILVSTVNALDQNNHNYVLHVGNSTGASNLCNSSSTPNGTEANCSFTVPWTSGIHTIYGRLTDPYDTSVEKNIVFTVDVTPPIYVSSGVSPSSLDTDENTSITASITLTNGTMDYVKVKVVDINLVSTIYTMSNINGTWTYIFSPTSAGTYSVSTIYAADDSGNVMSPQSVSHPFTVADVTGGAAAGGAGPSNITVAGDLTLTPDRRDTYFWYTAVSGDRKGVWKFTANRNIETCRVDPNTHATCEIVDGYIVLVTLTVNETVKTYDGTLTVTDDLDYTASSTLVVRVIKLWGSIPIGEINVGPLAMSLSSVFETEETYLIGIRTWVLALIFGLFGLGVYKSFKH